MRTSLGADLGATWLRVCLSDGRRRLWSDKVPAAGWRELPKVLPRILRVRGLRRVGAITVGGTRLGGGKERAGVRRGLAPVAPRVEVGAGW